MSETGPERALREFARQRAEAAQSETLSVAGPSVGERIIHTAMHVAAIITLVLTSIFLVLVLLTMARVGQAIDRISPEPASTGCPFGDLECGG